MKNTIYPPLDPQFRSMAIWLRNYQNRVVLEENIPLAICILRNGGFRATYRMRIFKDTHSEETNRLVERIVKTLLWIKGGYEIVIGGSKEIYEGIRSAYQPGGLRAFDAEFMARVYERAFTVRFEANAENVPDTYESSSAIGRHLNGCRIGFDAGGSDRKVSAVIDGNPVYSEEVVWHPKTQSDPAYHYAGILDAMRTAASKMPRVDAIGISSAGVYVDNRIMVASLFLQVPKDAFDSHVKDMYIRVCKEIGDVPFVVANDGDVTALAGAMNLNDNAVLGIAMGTSEAGGYVDETGNITGWLNELAFVPVDANPLAPIDEWSLDIGCGVKYFSQDAVNRLAPLAGILFPDGLTPAEKLKYVQTLAEKNDPRTNMIYETIGVYFGHAIAYYCMFYRVRHVLIMGRVTSGAGGQTILQKARTVLANEFPEFQHVCLSIPDEASRRIGQSVAAASLPNFTNECTKH